MRFLSHLVLLLAVALTVGFGLSWYALNDGRLVGASTIGPWSAWQRAGSPDPDPYTMAFITRNAALQLGQSEGVQLIATTDSDGEPLDRACRYRIDGKTPTAAFWTLVPVAPDGSLAAAPGGPSGFHSARVARSNDGSMQLYLSKTLAPLNWLELAGNGAFQLRLTLYDTTLFSAVGGGESALPSILRESC